MNKIKIYHVFGDDGTDEYPESLKHARELFNDLKGNNIPSRLYEGYLDTDDEDGIMEDEDCLERFLGYPF